MAIKLKEYKMRLLRRIPGNRLVDYGPYYKVIYKGHSIFAIGEAMVEYIPMEWTKTPARYASQGYYLTFFDTYENARSFMVKSGLFHYHGSPMTLYECDVWNRIDEIPKRGYIEPKTNNLKFPSVLAHTWPTGTMMAQEIMITRPVPVVGQPRLK